MQDRIPTYPGRVKLTPVTGEENTYDMERADGPVQEGTPINAWTLLENDTAELFELTGEAAIPNNAFKIIGKNWTLDKLMSITTEAEAAQIELDLSGVDMTKYNGFKLIGMLFPAYSVGHITNAFLELQINNDSDSNYYSTGSTSSSSSAGTSVRLAGDLDQQAVGLHAWSLSTEILPLNTSAISVWSHNITPGVTNNAVTGVSHGFYNGIYKGGVFQEITKLTFFVANLPSGFGAGSTLELLGVRK